MRQAVVQQPKAAVAPQAVVQQPKVVAAQKVAMLQPKASPSDQRRAATALANKVRLLIREGKLDQAGEYVHQLESVSGVDSLVSLRIRAYWMLSSNKDRNALSIYHQILNREPNDVSANLNTALAEWRLGHPQAASKRLKKFLDKNPANKQASSMLNQLRKIR